jgi:hypothetical protein
MILNRGKTAFFGTVQAAGKDDEQGQTSRPMSSFVGRIFVGLGLFLLTNGVAQSCIFLRANP